MSDQWAVAEDLASLLDLEQLDRDLYRGCNAAGATIRRSLYGGQVAAQALRAAGATVPDDRRPHSLHGYFLRPGRADLPVLLHVDRDRDGRSFSARHVRAVQDGEVIFSMLASFHVDEPSGVYDALPTDPAPLPEQGGGWRADVLLEVREVTPLRVDRDRLWFPDTIWVRTRTPLPDDRLVRACALTYVSDLGSGFGQVEVPGLGGGGSSIDHAVWFQDDVAPDQWMLLKLLPTKAGGSRGVYAGVLRDAGGALGLFCTQELLLRPHRPDQLAAIQAAIDHGHL
jgi:acyl-CoA thioesterase-2